MKNIGKHTDAENKARRIPKWIWLLTVIFCFVFVFSGVQIIRMVSERKAADHSYSELSMQFQTEDSEQKNGQSEIAVVNSAVDSDEQPSASEQSQTFSWQKTMDFSTLQEENPNLVAWISCDGTKINYPVMHTDNNDYYLTHLYNGSINKSGSIFVDYRNTDLFTEKNTVIYGHNMRNGTMFRSLTYYKNQKYFDKHPTMMLYTPDGDYVIELICGTIEDGNSKFVQFEFDNDDSLFQYVAELKARSTFESDVTLQSGDRIVSLCTCTYERKNGRYLLVGRITPVSAEPEE